MALTRITGTVIEDNAITSDKISNLSVTTAMIASGAITADKLAANTSTAGPITTQIAAVSLALSANVNTVKANVDASEANIAAILNTTTDLNIGSGKYFFDKNRTAFGISNTNPIVGTISIIIGLNIIFTLGAPLFKDLIPYIFNWLQNICIL